MNNIDLSKLVTAADKLSQAKTAQITLISQGCQTAIFAGFTSSALGSVYTYPFKTTDQANLSDSVLASTLPGNAANWVTPFWCADSSGFWARRNHTAAQIQQVGKDAMARKLSCMAQNSALAGQVNAATDAAGVSAIVWVAPT